MHLYLPVALTSINILVPVGLGLAVGLLSGLFGVGGGFLMTPLLIMFGIPSTVAAATDSNQIVAASTSGTYAHWKVGNVDFKMGLYLLVGGFLGGIVGVQAIKLLHAMGNADFVIKMTYMLMLGIVGGYMFIESLQSMKKKKGAQAVEVKEEKESAVGRFLKSLPLQTRFEKSGITHSVLVPIVLGSVRGRACRDHGRGRRVPDGADHGLYAPDADACGRRNEPVPDPLHLHRGDVPAGLYEPQRGFRAGGAAAPRVPPSAPRSERCSAGSSRPTSSRSFSRGSCSP